MGLQKMYLKYQGAAELGFRDDSHKVNVFKSA